MGMESVKMAHSQESIKAVTIQLRAREEQRSLIDKAAHILGRNRSDFLLDVACREAEQVLLDQRLFSVDEETYQAFLEALDSPPNQNPKLKKLLKQKAPWDK
jgi:uncharacterized protein (DUF1778 family)